MPAQISPHPLEPWYNITGKVVLVTGASSGIGVEFCLDLARAGCRIIAAARRLDRLKSLCHEINQMTGLPLPDAGHGAGNLRNAKSPLDLSEEEWNEVFKTSLTGIGLVSKYVCIRMRDAQRKGTIINISSNAGLNQGHLPGGSAYASSKSGVNTLTKIMALELGVHKIRLNCLSPALFKSEITEKLMQKDWPKKVALKTVPLRTHGTSNPALTSLVGYLIHDSSEYVSGNDFIVEAGATLPGVPIYSSL
ncbi:unnamed protein product [Lupinus luteus]|uniref:Uncharacterized protein n=1 Tax=Lupinus luteus TaxID=3873 RepID=A0AAV1VR59_LUPLU